MTSSRLRGRPAAIAVAALMAASVTRGAARPARESALEALPATFAGLLPCADCVGIPCQINLLREGAYVQRDDRGRLLAELEERSL